MHLDHPVHVAEIDRDPAQRRVDMAFERGTGAERDHRHPVLCADAYRRLHIGGVLREHHRIRRLVLDPGHGVAVLLAHRARGHEPVAEMGGEFGHDRLHRARVARPILRSCKLRCDRHGYWTFFQKIFTTEQRS